MSEFRIAQLPNSSVLYLYSMRDAIQLDPEYQREGGIWSIEKRQLLIDSLLNGYDIPKIYFHEFYPAKLINGKKYKYAIVDGKQRLQSIWGFIDGDFALPTKFQFFRDPSVDLSGLTYRELSENYPLVKARFDGTTLAVITIQTDEMETIEDMFSRLNEAVPLNAAEKRNAFGGLYPDVIRSVAATSFFKKCLPFKNARYRYYDLATKFLYTVASGAIVDLKKRYLDEFVRTGKSVEPKKLAKEVAQVDKVLKTMRKTFTADDELLRSVAIVTLYFLLFYEAVTHSWIDDINRKSLVKFEEERNKNRAEAEADGGTADYDLLEFDRFAQSPNDGIALDFRYKVLRERIGPHPRKLKPASKAAASE